MKKTKQRKIRRAASNVMLVCLLAIAALSIYNIVKIQRDYDKDRAVYDDVRVNSSFSDGSIDWAKLKRVNSDVIGWLRLDGTTIDYPVVQGDDNETYLHTLFDGSYGGCGTLFADYRHEEPFGETNTIIYGHHMRDGSMFHDLKEYRSRDYAKAHPILELETPGQKYDVRVAAFLTIEGDSPLYKTSFSSRSERADWVKSVSSNAEYLTNEAMSYDSRYVMLSTCAGSSESLRYVVVGKLVYRKAQ